MKKMTPRKPTTPCERGIVGMHPRLLRYSRFGLLSALWLGYLAWSLSSLDAQAASHSTPPKGQANAKTLHKKRAKRMAPFAAQTTGSYRLDTRLPALAEQVAQHSGQTLQVVLRSLKTAKHLPNVVRWMTPAPPQSSQNDWLRYRAQFMTPIHRKRGLAFWQANAEALARAEQQYGVPASIIMGILGVETMYGQNKGTFSVLDVLTTLCLDYPREHPRRTQRTAYFCGELSSLFELAHFERTDVRTMRGSFAGAMGYPQFMPSSWRQYGVDFDGDGHVDLRHSAVDAIGSIAHYLKAYGWKTGEPTHYGTYHGAPTAEGTALPTFKGRLVLLERADAEPIQVDAAPNFFVIARYNDSWNYVSAVVELGNWLQTARTAKVAP